MKRKTLAEASIKLRPFGSAEQAPLTPIKAAEWRAELKGGGWPKDVLDEWPPMLEEWDRRYCENVNALNASDPELSAEGAAKLASILSRPGKRIPKLAALLKGRP